MCFGSRWLMCRIWQKHIKRLNSFNRARAICETLNNSFIFFIYQIWKHKGEEFRTFFGGGWYWVSSTRKRRPLPPPSPAKIFLDESIRKAEAGESNLNKIFCFGLDDRCNLCMMACMCVCVCVCIQYVCVHL